MKTSFSIFSLAVAATAMHAQGSFIGGLDFTAAPALSADVAFDKGPDADLFTLYIQTNAEDNNTLFGSFTDTGWAALNDTYTDGSFDVAAGQPNFDVTVKEVSGYSPSSTEFGGTSAFAQGYTDTFGLAFLANTDGFFSIGFTAPIDDFQISFDVAAEAGQGNSAGDLTVSTGGTDMIVGVTTSSANQTLSFGDVDAGLLTFDLTDLDGGLVIDNLMISGTVIPEPSSAAVLFGFFGLAFVATRRRK